MATATVRIPAMILKISLFSAGIRTVAVAMTHLT